MKLKEKYRQYEKGLYLWASVMLFVIGGVIAFLGNKAENPLLILLGFAGLAIGFMLFLAWRRMGVIRIEEGQGEEGKGEERKAPPNSLILYPDRVVFAYVENPQGQAQKCYNDGQLYHILKGEGDTKVELCLPDDDESERYYDPAEFANPVTMPSNKKYFTWSASTMQKISVGIMAIVIAGELIGMIVLGG